MIWILLVSALVIVAVPVATVYVPFLRSAEKRWSRCVLRAYGEAQRRASALARECEQLDKRRQTEEETSSRQAFQRFLASISVRELEKCPGIGPATVGRLQQNGYTSLARLKGATVRIAGLGARRMADVQSAVWQLTREAESRFRAGACKEARALAAEAAERALRYQQLRSRAEGREKAAAEVAAQLGGPAALARKMTFWRCYWKGAETVVPPDVLRCRLPDLLAALNKADQQARADMQPATPVRRAPSAPSPRFLAPQPQADPSQDALEAIVQFVYAIARADGSLTHKEKELIADVMEGLHGKDPPTYNRVKAYCAHYETAAIDVGFCITRIGERASADERGQLFSIARRVAEAAGTMNERECRLLERVAREWDVPWVRPLGESDAVAAQPVSVTPAPPGAQEAPSLAAQDPRSVLEIDLVVPLTADLIRRRFNLLLERMAPEKAEAMGAEFVAIATAKRESIRAAAETLLERLGEPLETPKLNEAPAELRHNPDLDAMFGA
jgi:uncharacterized tellurite resistance protein B-like protein